MKKALQIAVLCLLAALMFLASGQHGSYFCVSPWTGDAPLASAHTDAHP